jgi:antitoxin VapB
LTVWDIPINFRDIRETIVASLFIKDAETNALAAQIADRLGTTKTEAVRRGLSSLNVASDPKLAPVAGSTADWLRAYRARRPLPDREAMKLDKAFFDSLSDQDDVFDPWAP